MRDANAEVSTEAESFGRIAYKITLDETAAAKFQSWAMGIGWVGNGMSSGA